MKSIDLHGMPLFGIAISDVLDMNTKPEREVLVITEMTSVPYMKHVRFCDPKSRVVIGELLNAYHEVPSC